MSSRRLMLSALLFCCSVPAVMAAELHMYAGAGLRPPIEKVISQFEKETGNTVTVEYGGSGQILTRFELTKQGDLFFPGSADYVEKLQKEKQVTDSYPIVRHIPVIAVRKDKADGINSIADLAASICVSAWGTRKPLRWAAAVKFYWMPAVTVMHCGKKSLSGRQRLNTCRCICLTVRWMLRLSAAPMP